MVEQARSTDPAAAGGIPYYNVRLALTEEGQKKMADLKLIPGMPAEAHIKTGDRTAFTYFTKPLSDQFARAFRER
jgi:HlyD family secretion protein